MSDVSEASRPLRGSSASGWGGLRGSSASVGGRLRVPTPLAEV
ncbi:hypothetical protein [Tessaracoccus sp. MC1679]|nr:hypothetical protein [Tessaracoccus sp. MC1679]